MSDDNHSSKAQGITLEALNQKLRGRCEAIVALQGGHTYYSEEVTIFRKFAEENGLILSELPPEIDRPYDDCGNEHEVWYVSSRNSYIKVTWPDFFGKLVVYRSDEEADASPIQYLERWQLHNEIFGDDVRFLGLYFTEDNRMRLVIEQSAIAGIPADNKQIQEFFESTGWRPFKIGRDLAFYDPDLRIAVSDTHPGNLILMADGLFAAIDLRVQKLTSAEEHAIKPLLK